MVVRSQVIEAWAWFFLAASLSAVAAFGLFALARRGTKAGQGGALLAGLVPALLVALGRVFWVYGRQFWDRVYLIHNFFRGPYLWAWLAFLGGQALILAAGWKQKYWTPRRELHGVWLFAVILIALGVLCPSLRALSAGWNLAPAWTSFFGLIPLFAVMILLSFSSPGSGALGLTGPNLPLWECMIFFVLPIILSCVMGIWFLVSLFFPGNPAPLPLYIPLLSPLDMLEAFCMVLIYLWQFRLARAFPRFGPFALGMRILVDCFLFFFITALTVRTVRFYGNFGPGELLGSGAFQLSLFVVWALYGIAHIIGGSRLAKRKLWIAGALITVADVVKLLVLDLAGARALTRIISFFVAGILLLFIGWVSPLPPSDQSVADTQGGSHD